MDELRVKKDGLHIPSAWLKGFGGSVAVERGPDLLIIESPRRAAARENLKRMVGRLRRAARRNGAPSREEIVAEVVAVRARRARHR